MAHINPSFLGPRPGGVAWCWHGDCCPWHRQGKCFFRHDQETGVRPCLPDTVEQEEDKVPAILMESLVAVQQELAALKKEVIELRRISNAQKEKRRAKRARPKERKAQDEDPHREEGQDQTEGTHITAEGAEVVMSDSCEKPQEEEEVKEDSSECPSWLGAFSTWSQRSSSGTCSDTCESQEEEAAAAAAAEGLLEAEHLEEEEKSESQIGEMLQQLVAEWNQYKRGTFKGHGKGKGKGKSKEMQKGKNQGRGSGGRRQAARRGSGA